MTKNGDRQNVEVTELTDADPMEGDVTVAIEHSTVNYKDGLAITGKAPIIRKFPLIPGIDLAGRVLRSEDPRFHKLGYRVVTSSRRAEQEADYLQGLGVDEIIDARDLSGAGSPLGKERWVGAIDSLGSRTLANELSQIKYDGAVAGCGLAQGPDLPATVMPFIVRDVTLAGVNSVVTPTSQRTLTMHRGGTRISNLSNGKQSRTPQCRFAKHDLDRHPRAADRRAS